MATEIQFKAQQTKWDDLPSDEFRFIHEDNVLTMTHHWFSTDIVWSIGNGIQISPRALEVWQNNDTKWYRKKITKNNANGYVYTKQLSFDPGEHDGGTPAPHRITILAFAIKTLGGGVNKVLFGYLQQLAESRDDGHTGEWR